MTDKELLEKGYFAKELPPPFQTKMFADKLANIKADWKIVTTTIDKALKPEKEIFKENFGNPNG